MTKAAANYNQYKYVFGSPIFRDSELHLNYVSISEIQEGEKFIELRLYEHPVKTVIKGKTYKYHYALCAQCKDTYKIQFFSAENVALQNLTNFLK